MNIFRDDLPCGGVRCCLPPSLFFLEALWRGRKWDALVIVSQEGQNVGDKQSCAATWWPDRFSGVWLTCVSGTRCGVKGRYFRLKCSDLLWNVFYYACFAISQGLTLSNLPKLCVLYNANWTQCVTFSSKLLNASRWKDLAHYRIWRLMFINTVYFIFYTSE